MYTRLGKIAQLLQKMAYSADQRQWLSSACRELWDEMSITLVLCGRKGRGSKLHFDWAEAVNLLLPLMIRNTKLSEREAFALRLFVMPHAIHDVRAVMQNNAMFKGKGLGEQEALTQEDMVALEVLANEGRKEKAVVLVKQHAYEAVKVPPGTPHAVVNLQVSLNV